MADNVRFLSGDGFVRPEEARESQVIAVEGTPDAAIVHVFDSDAEFENWARTTPHANSVTGIMQNIRDLNNNLERANAEEEHWLAELNRIDNDMDALAKKTGLAPGSIELFRRATIERPHNEPSIFDPAVFYADPHGGGAWRWVHGASHNLSNWGWNDRVSSISVWGGCLLTEHSWWRGRKLFLLGVPGLTWNLPDFGFDNIASSIALS